MSDFVNCQTSASMARSSSEDYQPQYEKSSLSRRSIDWRDSGIVIDEDQNFNPIEAICDIKPGTSCAQQAPVGTRQNRVVLDQDDDGDTILHLAVVGCTLDKVKDLIKICDLNAINDMMQTPLHVATMVNRPEMVDILIKSGARLNVHDRRGNTPLHLACKKGFTDIVTTILDSVGDKLSLEQHIEASNFDGQNCLHLAATNDRTRIIEILVDRYGANLDSQDSRSGETILHKAIQNFNIDLVDFVSRLGKHCNQADYTGRRPLDTLRIISQSRLDKSQRDRLSIAEKLLNDRIYICIEQNGCCKPGSIQMSDEILDSSSSSSDYSDSDSDMS